MKKENVQLFLLDDIMILYRENMKDSTKKKMLQLIKICKVIGCKSTPRN